jgi:5-methylcytosine-specific restriction endonuclease McrA
MPRRGVGCSRRCVPSAPRDPAAQRRVLRFEVAPETFALFREARSELRRRSHAAFDDDAVLLEMSRLVLGGPRDEGRSSYQVSLHVCSECAAGQQAASGELVSVGPEIVAMARCDGQNIGRLPLQPTTPLVGQAVPANETTPRLESAPVGAKPRARADRVPATERAQQNIPPALRRAVRTRDQRRCRVPGCRNATFLDVHHLELRSEGGRHAAENLLTVCDLHHRALHRGKLVVEGSSASAVFRHADGSGYGHPLQPRALDAAAKVFAGLRNLGFRESEVRQVLCELRKDNQLRDASAEALLRQALQRLRPPRPPFQ